MRLEGMTLEERMPGIAAIIIILIMTVSVLFGAPTSELVSRAIIGVLALELFLLTIVCITPSRQQESHKQEPEHIRREEPTSIRQTRTQKETGTMSEETLPSKTHLEETKKTEYGSHEAENGRDPGEIICCGGILYLVLLYLTITMWASGGVLTLFLVMMMIILVPGMACVAFIRQLGEDDESRRYTLVREAIMMKGPSHLRQEVSEAIRPEFWQSADRSGHDAADKVLGAGLPTHESKDGSIRALRGGEIVGSRFRFKVKVVNDSDHIINDVTVFVLSFPRDALELASKDDDCQFSKIEPGGFRSPHFDFRPTQDCIRGEIVAGVSYVDPWGKAHTLATRPFTIRAVCDLLKPEAIGVEEFKAKLKDLEAGEIVVKVEDWTPEEMYEKTLKVLGDSNFHEVECIRNDTEGVFVGKISGWARGRYTGKTLGVEVSIAGPSSRKGASCRIRVAGEDDAMILPAISDLQDRLSAYLCPMCFSKLTVENVEALKAGRPVRCPFCGVAIGR